MGAYVAISDAHRTLEQEERRTPMSMLAPGRTLDVMLITLIRTNNCEVLLVISIVAQYTVNLLLLYA